MKTELQNNHTNPTAEESDDLLRYLRNWHKEYCLIGAEDTVICAVSGGADSMAMADLFRQYYAIEGRLRLIIAHFNHHLRLEADQEAEMVKNWCNGNGLTFEYGEGDVAGYAESTGVPIHTAARVLRYNFLTSLYPKSPHKRVVCTAHHQDDQAETLLLRLFSGSGAKGLSGIRQATLWKESGVTIVRPLLGATRQQLREHCVVNAVPFMDDASNNDIHYPRNRVRRNLLPVIAEQFGASAVAGIARSAELFSLIAEYIDTISAVVWNEAIIECEEHQIILDSNRYNSYLTMLRLRLLQRAYQQLSKNQRPPSLRLLQNADKALLLGANGTYEINSGIAVRQEKGRTYVFHSTPNRQTYTLQDGGTVTFPGFGELTISSGEPNRFPDLHSIPDGVLICDSDRLSGSVLNARYSAPGDRIFPFKAKSSQRVTEILRAHGVPRHLRSYPIICDDDDEIIAIPPYVIADRVKVTSDSRKITIFTWKTVLSNSHPQSIVATQRIK